MSSAGTTTSSLHKKCPKMQQIQGLSIGDPSVCFFKYEFTEKMHSFVDFTNNILKIDVFAEWCN